MISKKMTRVFEADAKPAASALLGGFYAQRFGRALCDGGHLVLPRVDEAVFERRDHDQVHEREHRRHDQEQGQGKPGADRLQVSHGSRSR